LPLDAGADASVVDASVPPPPGFVCALERSTISDLALQRREIRTADAAGRLGIQDIDGDGDGVYETRRFYSYNAHGKKVSEEDDKDIDGTIDVFRYFFVDPDTDRTLYYLIDTDVAAINGFEIQWIYKHDDDGHVIERIRDNSPDPNLDEGPEVDLELVEFRSYTFDAEGRETLRVYDRQYDGSDNYSETRVYDEDGLLIEQQLDDPGGNNPVDGVIDAVWSWDYDAQGRVVQRLFDSDNDGTFDTREQRFYDCE